MTDTAATRMGDIGEPEHEIEIEPLEIPEHAPITEPAPQRQPEPVPA